MLREREPIRIRRNSGRIRYMRVVAVISEIDRHAPKQPGMSVLEPKVKVIPLQWPQLTIRWEQSFNCWLEGCLRVSINSKENKPLENRKDLPIMRIDKADDTLKTSGSCAYETSPRWIFFGERTARVSSYSATSY
jgi:hypothetical protein